MMPKSDLQERLVNPIHKLMIDSYYLNALFKSDLLQERWKKNQRTNGPVNAHLISWPSKAQNKQNLENIW